MIGATLLTEIVTLASAVSSLFGGDSQTLLSGSRPSFSETCQEIASSISSASNIYDPNSAKYLEDILHWTSSSSQYAACSLEPGTAADIGAALRILGRTRTPFAVKGGGHATNPGFSSTEGVQIAMTRFDEVVYDSKTQTVTIGAGQTWDAVYAALEPYGVNVAGGRIAGVGVAGYTLGGGYSWHTNQYGLTIDSVLGYELVMPNGTVIDVTETSSPDLFFALKGGMNNYGIVTKFTFKTFSQTKVWGGIISYSEDVLDQFIAATANFAANNTDPKAGIIALYRSSRGQFGTALNIFYDAPTPPPGVFDEFLAIPWSTREVSTRSFLSFVKSLLSPFHPARFVFNTVSVTSYPVDFIQSMINETHYWSKHLPEDVSSFSYDVQPFLPSLFDHNTTPTAYPPSRAQALYPFNFHFLWRAPSSDEAVYDATRRTARTLWARANMDLDDQAVVYPNYGIFDTPVEHLYGEHVPRLRAIKKAVDPEDVMGLAGGFKI
ncbi:FAD-binding domain-containing protein [Chiua virens]|nr:FAD-binding domain-containing protein [Chiua virens]